MGSGSENEEERMTRKDISKKIGRNQYLTDCGVGRGKLMINPMISGSG